MSITFDKQSLLLSQKEAPEANARLKCVYFPVVEVCNLYASSLSFSPTLQLIKSRILQGKENIERILEKLEHEGCRIPENYETFSRVSIRRLGRLLPDARWVCC